MKASKIIVVLITLAGLLILFIYSRNRYNEYLFEKRPLTLLKTDGPGGLDCDEFKEVFHVLQTTPTFAFDTTVSYRDYIMPYPLHKAEDTTYFYRYYHKWQSNIDGVVYFEGKFRGIYSAGGENSRYGCESVIHFEVYKIYDSQKRLLVDFALVPHNNARIAPHRLSK
jgi:hypothetical protein